jgi:uncharacterized membrane protein YesL
MQFCADPITMFLKNSMKHFRMSLEQYLKLISHAIILEFISQHCMLVVMIWMVLWMMDMVI